MALHPFAILFIGIFIVVGMIVVLRINAFIALITAAIAVSLLAPGEVAEKISRVAAAFGGTAGGIGIVIALAAIIGKCMMDSGAADRIVRAFLSVLGEKRGGAALAGSGFALSIPVFFDTVFYLLIPLARSMHRRTGRTYLKYLMAIAAGGALTHNLVPPTPGPLAVADTLGVDIGTMILIGALVGLPAVVVGMLYSAWADRKMGIPMREVEGESHPPALPDDQLPSLGVALLPIVLPIVLISANTIVNSIAMSQTGAEDAAGLLAAAKAGSGIAQAAQWTALLGNANLALLLAAAICIVTLYVQRRPTRLQMAQSIEQALMSGGVIILITAAGGAFGAMLKAAEIGPAIATMVSGDDGGRTGGFVLLIFGFAVASLIKFAQGSSTVAGITTAALVAAMITGDTELGFNPVYLATAIGSGALVGSWMNDSGFWIFSKMGGLTEIEALKTWTPLLAILGCASMATTLLLAAVLPLT